MRCDAAGVFSKKKNKGAQQKVVCCMHVRVGSNSNDIIERQPKLSLVKDSVTPFSLLHYNSI